VFSELLFIVRTAPANNGSNFRADDVVSRRRRIASAHTSDNPAKSIFDEPTLLVSLQADRIANFAFSDTPERLMTMPNAAGE
jgi:hypothetical protein